ncbi:FAD-binding oxidoreductase [Granulicella sp. WH15]|uniref:FAD-binding oxidoreductase n=1 Tax=Granulicella sp. WH15 TaxID=2602070 RepID=UPI001366946C|nr:FAD-binding oxidoreductase [Granulicella sp. WH15]QHN02975.1 FAD-binding oxidoreductase [Granulicella sp. WH15]
MTSDDLQAVTACVSDADRVITNAQIVQRLSRDFYWYSPVLKKLLDDKVAEVVVQPVSTAEVVKVLACCYARGVPVTARGAGTGNYGQAIPLHGGVVLDLLRMDAIEEITGDGVAVVEPGVRLGVLENAARAVGWELRCYPSTIVKASVGGFLGGGSGGIGSVAHGGLRSFATVRAVEVVTMEAEPRVVLHKGEAVHEVLHAWGTNGIMTKVWLALTPAVAWAQCAVAFASFDAAFDFGEKIACDEAWMKRLVTVFEWPIPSCFTSIANVTRSGQALVFLMIAEAQLEQLRAAAEAAGGEVTLAAPYSGLRTVPLLSDYTWNHTTLWAMKQDSAFTYLQCGFSASQARRQFAVLKEKFGDELLLHLEFLKTGTGEVIPAAIPLVRFTTEERLNEMIDFCRSIGVSVANPHSNSVEGGGRYREDNIQLLTKQRYDPRGLLNPGKMVTFQPQ